ncbi:unnamed protein product [Calicophoron daubneyi]|uniref:Uncharacterized protein n=1 Tax=Calicophoron daubneyi TaxID=300641 RepID=A0AAV2T911_CALDB
MSCQEKRRLILHFDARNTLFVADKCYRLTVEEALNSYLTGLVWCEKIEAESQENENFGENGEIEVSDGISQPHHHHHDPLVTSKPHSRHADANGPDRPPKMQVLDEIKQNNGLIKPDDEDSSEKPTSKLDAETDDQTHQSVRQPYRGENFQELTPDELRQCQLNSTLWRCLPSSPCMRQPRPDAISIYKLLESQLVRKPADRGRLRKYLGNFTQTPQGRPFLELFKKHLEILRWPSEIVSDDQTNSHSKLTVVGKNKEHYHYLMPAFYRLITWLIKTHRNFAILIRTYGCDGPHILNAIDTYLQGHHPTEKMPGEEHKFKVDFSTWRLRRQDSDPKFTLFKDDGSAQPGPDAVTEQSGVYETWSSWDCATTVVDDFVYWQSNHYMHSAAKPFWFDPKDNRVHHILFDDNIRFEDDGSNGIDLLRLTDSPNESVRLPQEEAMKWENVYFVQADLLSIIRDKNYFIDRVQECENNLNKLQSQAA